MTDFIRNLVEIKGFGFNLLTFVFAGTIFFSVLQGWGLWRQTQKVWESRSGDSVSVLFFGYGMFYFFAFIFYGIHEAKLAAILNGALGFVYIPLMVGLHKFKGFTRKEVSLLIVFSLMVPAMIFMPVRQMLLMIFLFGVAGATIFQIVELVKLGKAGVIEPRFYAVFIITAFFWWGYSFLVNDWPLKVFNPLAIVLNLIILFLWFKDYAKSGRASVWTQFWEG